MSVVVMYEQHPALLDWADRVLSERLGPVRIERPAHTISIADDGGLVCVVALTQFIDDMATVTVAGVGRRFATRRTLKAVFGYIFDVLGIRRLNTSVRSDNVEAIEFNLRSGFVREGALRKASKVSSGDYVDMVFFGMFREECRWLGGV